MSVICLYFHTFQCHKDILVIIIYKSLAVSQNVPNICYHIIILWIPQKYIFLIISKTGSCHNFKKVFVLIQFFCFICHNFSYFQLFFAPSDCYLSCFQHQLQRLHISDTVRLNQTEESRRSADVALLVFPPRLGSDPPPSYTSASQSSDFGWTSNPAENNGFISQQHS